MPVRQAAFRPLLRPSEGDMKSQVSDRDHLGLEGDPGLGGSHFDFVDRLSIPRDPDQREETDENADGNHRSKENRLHGSSREAHSRLECITAKPALSDGERDCDRDHTRDQFVENVPKTLAT